ncbi:hypothetical protein N798_07485 [Knoellia flava TL1]|uniref:Fibronectin type-III domain-containing protein n=1 Tax=Knoellia flava TL1 TaxID=1385518 RepID=A0ABR4XF66_9MICO|nr:hypothetical protein N798_07485 [Knoellia flava TL1]
MTPQEPDFAAPALSQFDFTPKSADVNAGSKDVVVTARVTDATGAEAPTLILTSDNTTQTLGFGSMTRISGTATDGIYQRTVTIPTTAATGTWSVTIYPLDDTLGNDDNTFHVHPSKLTVTSTPPDVAAPVLSQFDFTPKSADVNAGSKDVVVTARVTDATGAEAPTLILTSDNTTQTLGFGSMTRISGTATDGIYQRTVTIPTTAATGTWSVTIYPLDDTLGNDDNTFHVHPSKLTVTRTPPVTAPGAPTAVTATAGDTSATVSWTAPTNTGGAPITGYTVTASPGGKTATTTGATTATLTGLSNGTSYTFTVTATNSAGTSPTSTPSNTITPKAPVTAPSAPTAVTATAGDTSATVSWTAPTNTGGAPITGYTVTASPGGKTATTTGATTATLTGLSNGTSYTFTVTATNSAGTSPTSTPSNTITPSAPSILSVVTPTVTGGSKPGYVKTANAGSWGPSPVALSYRWSRVSATGVVTPIRGATNAKYRVSTADVGYRLTVTVTGTKTGYSTASRTSASTSFVTAWRR